MSHTPVYITIYTTRFLRPNTVKPVLRGHLWDNEKVAL